MRKNSSRSHWHAGNRRIPELRSKRALLNYLNSREMATALSIAQLCDLAKTGPELYGILRRSKSDGTVRVIENPVERLKKIQWCVADLLKEVPCSKASYGGVAGRGHIRAAAEHVGAETLAVVDIRKFYPSFRKSHLVRVLKELGSCPAVIRLLTGILLVRSDRGLCLPHGSPCSPVIADLLLYRLDTRLRRMGRERGVVVTRLTDGYQFSGDDREAVFLVWSEAKSEILNLRFRINSKKTKITSRGAAKIVGGLQVDKKLEIPRDPIDGARISRTGVEEELLAAIANRRVRKQARRLNGLIGYVRPLHRRLGAAWKTMLDRALRSEKRPRSKTRKGRRPVGLDPACN